MKLYKRDYTKLTPKELADWDTERKRIKANTRDGFLDGTFRVKFSKPIWHYKSLFPNNYLDPWELKKRNKLVSLWTNFSRLLNRKRTTERHILNFIRDSQAYFVIGSILNNYTFGHHDAYLFQEFQIPPNYKSDFLIVGKSSMGYEFIFVELENPYSKVTNGDGSFGQTIRKGYKQIEDWEKWLDANFSNLKLVFDKFKGKVEELPREFIDFDKTRIHFVIVAGKRSDFNDRTYRNKRKEKRNNILVLHYDNLLDSAKAIIGATTY